MRFSSLAKYFHLDYYFDFDRNLQRLAVEISLFMDYSNFPNLVLFQLSKQGVVDSFRLSSAGITLQFLMGPKQMFVTWKLAPWGSQKDNQTWSLLSWNIPIYFCIICTMALLVIISVVFSPQHFASCLVLNKFWLNINKGRRTRGFKCQGEKC